MFNGQWVWALSSTSSVEVNGSSGRGTSKVTKGDVERCPS